MKVCGPVVTAECATNVNRPSLPRAAGLPASTLDSTVGQGAFWALPHIRATLDACAEANCPAGQATIVHAADPEVNLNVPGAHGIHVSPFAPVNPALHVQLLRTLLPSEASELKGQL